MKKILLIICFLVSVATFAQNNGITYQAVIYSTTGESIPGIKNPNSPLANKEICLQFSIIDGSTQTEYQEKIKATTDLFGMVNLVIGNGTQTGGYASSFVTIDWSDSPKYLKVSLDQSGNCAAFEEISNQVLNYVPFALAAKSAASVTGIVGIAHGGTNATTVLGAKTNLQLQNVDNTSDLNKPLSTATQTALNSKVDIVAGKDLSTEDYTTDEKTKLAAISGVNTGDQDLSSFATTADLTTKVDKVTGKNLSSNDFTTAEKTKLAAISGVNTGDQDLSSFATTTDLNLKVDKVTGKDLSSNDFTTAEKTKLAAISGTNTGDQDLSSFATTSSVNEALNNKFVDLTTNQTIAGKKTFNADMDVNGDLKVIGVISNPTVMLENSAIETGTWGADQWQSFTATASGILNKISIFGNGLIGDRTGTLTIYAGTGTSGTQLYSGSTALPPSSGWFDLAINSNLKIEIGQVYSFRIEDQNSVISPGGMVASINNRYTQGDYYSSVYGANSNYDLNFKLWVGTLTGGSLLANGASFNEEVIASGFKIPSGTSSQYLMADGSVSNSTGSTNGSNVDLTTDQTISGVKTFGSNLIVNGMTVGSTSNSMMMGRPYSNTLFGYDVTTGNYASESSVFGYKASATGPQSIAIGSEASANQTQGISIGYHSSIGSGYGFAIGSYAQSNAMYSVALGAFSQTSGDYSVALGYQASATAENAIAIGKDATASTANTIQLGNTNVTDVKTSGYFNGTGFKTPSGTSSQYLMADGSVSTSTLSNYLPLTGGNITGAVAIGTSSPQTSALLDVTSTTQGFLPPRMTQDQRNAINNPVAGLVVWCKNCGESGELQVFNGTNWSNLIGGVTSEPLVVGSNYRGGKIAYIFQSGDPGYVAGEFHGIITSNTDLSNGIRWGQNNDGLSTTYDCTNRHGSSGYALPCAIGAGRTNTSLIISSNTEVNPTDYAAKICDNYSTVYNGVTYDDWFLPSYNEMLKVYQNKNAIGGLFYDATNPSSKSNWYWTSTGDVFQDRAADVNSIDGSKARNFRGYLLSVRAVRYF